MPSMLTLAPVGPKIIIRSIPRETCSESIGQKSHKRRRREALTLTEVIFDGITVEGGTGRNCHDDNIPPSYYIMLTDISIIQVKQGFLTMRTT